MGEAIRVALKDIRINGQCALLAWHGTRSGHQESGGIV